VWPGALWVEEGRRLLSGIQDDVKRGYLQALLTSHLVSPGSSITRKVIFEATVSNSDGSTSTKVVDLTADDKVYSLAAMQALMEYQDHPGLRPALVEVNKGVGLEWRSVEGGLVKAVISFEDDFFYDYILRHADERYNVKVSLFCRERVAREGEDERTDEI
jgi:hypothetical protein